jgi:hypothetical protein
MEQEQMSEIEVKHKGYDIRFNHADDTWSCEALSIPACPKLSTVKARIDALSKEDRRINVQAWMIVDDRWSDKPAKIERVTVTILCEPSIYRGETAAPIDCWITDAKRQRSKVSIKSLFALDCGDKLQKAMAAKAEAEKAVDAATELLDAMPRCNADMLTRAAKQQQKAPK